MKWNEFISRLKPEDNSYRFGFVQPCESRLIHQIEEEFQIKLPDELISLYQESDGIIEYLDDIEIGSLIWSADYLIQKNKMYRETSDFKDLYMPFDNLLFFGDAGNGDCFGYTILNGAIQRLDVFTWNHENDSRTWIASNLENFIDWWITGKIKL